MADINISISEERRRKLEDFCRSKNVDPIVFLQDFVDQLIDRKLNSTEPDKGKEDGIAGAVKEQTILLKAILSKLG